MTGPCCAGLPREVALLQKALGELGDPDLEDVVLEERVSPAVDLVDPVGDRLGERPVDDALTDFLDVLSARDSGSFVLPLLPEADDDLADLAPILLKEAGAPREGPIPVREELEPLILLTVRRFIDPNTMLAQGVLDRLEVGEEVLERDLVHGFALGVWVVYRS